MNGGGWGNALGLPQNIKHSENTMERALVMETLALKKKILKYAGTGLSNLYSLPH